MAVKYRFWCNLTQRFWGPFIEFESNFCIDPRIYDSDTDCEHVLPSKVGGNDADRQPDLANSCARASTFLKLRQRFTSGELREILDSENLGKIKESEIMSFLERHPRA